MTLLEMLLSLAIGLFLTGMMVKLYSLQETLHADIQQLSQLNRQAVITQTLLTNELESFLGPVEILDNGHKIQLKDKVFYISKNGLYSKKLKDNAVELISGVKDLTAKKINQQIEINIIVYIKGRGDESKGVHSNNSINLHFFVKLNSTLNT
jgi:hypothetical protein